MYAVLMIPIGFLPRYFHVTGDWSMWVVLVANIFMVVQCVRLYQDMGVPAARRVMFSSYIYLPVVYLSLLADKL
jgi:protoheme IX farnesyltransferase